MIKTLKESKAKLSELVERASRGEDVLITVRGRVKARLTRAPAAVHVASALASRAAWVVATDTRLRDAATLVALRVAP